MSTVIDIDTITKTARELDEIRCNVLSQLEIIYTDSVTEEKNWNWDFIVNWSLISISHGIIMKRSRALCWVLFFSFRMFHMLVTLRSQITNQLAVSVWQTYCSHFFHCITVLAAAFFAPSLQHHSNNYHKPNTLTSEERRVFLRLCVVASFGVLWCCADRRGTQMGCSPAGTANSSDSSQRGGTWSLWSGSGSGRWPPPP